MRLARQLALSDALLPLLERKRLIDAAWLVCLFASVASLAIPWFFSILDVDLTRAAGLVFIYALAYLALATITDRWNSMRAVWIVMRVMTMTSVLFLGALWHLAGGLDNPAFLLAFTLPVIISGVMLLGWQAHATALISIVVVAVVAVAESPDLRWYLNRLHAWPTYLALPISPLFTRSQRLAGLDATPGYEFIVVETFAVMQFIVAFLSTPLATFLLRINARLQTSTVLLTQVRGLFHAVLVAAPEPVVVVYADSGQVVEASESFMHRMLLRPSELVGKGIFELVSFVQPERVKQALESHHGQISFCAYTVDDEMRIANLSFHRTDHEGVGYVFLAWEELTELYYLQSAFDAIEDPVVVVGRDEKVQYGNRPAHALFGDLHFGAALYSLPKLQAVAAQCGAEHDNRAGRCEIDGRPYALHSLQASMPGDTPAGTIIWLHSIEREEALFRQATRDPLTGIYNRRYFDDATARNVELARRGQKLALAYFDLDGFKGINDTLGHAGGDAALIAFAHIVTSHLRDTDIFARRGGDEFAVLFVDCEVTIAGGVIERVLASMDTDGWIFEGERRSLRSSVGLAACHSGDRVEDLFERADQAVYAAKAAGKGRCVVAS